MRLALILQSDNISLLSHELRNPLQSINLANYLLQNKSISDDVKNFHNKYEGSFTNFLEMEKKRSLSKLLAVA